MALEAAEINGSPGTLITAGGRAIVALTLTGSDGRITAIQLLANPDKLAAVSAGGRCPCSTRRSGAGVRPAVSRSR